MRLLVAGLLLATAAHPDPLQAKFPQGALHAFLVVRGEDGKIIGTGDELNMQAGRVWKSRLTMKFRDGSIDDETAVYAQTPAIRLISDRHVQKGPSFPHPMDMSIDTAKKQIVWHDFKDGKDEVKTDTVADMPPDLSNGLMPLVVQNLPRGGGEIKMGYVVATPKPRVVKLAIRTDGEDNFSVGGGGRQAIKYRLHVELGGVAGVVAPIVGKEPPDLYMWVVQGEVPTFLRMNGFLYEGGPIWSVDLSSPTWPATAVR